jgi:hypothetical protein
MGFRTRYGSLGFGYESSYGVTAGSFQYVPAEVDLPDLGRQTQEMTQFTSAFGGNATPIIGGKDSGNSFTIRLPLEGFKVGYDPTAENPGGTGVIGSTAVLLGMALGSNASAASNHANLIAGAHLSNSVYDAGDVASATTGAITYTSGTYLEGQYIVDGATGTDFQQGWITDDDAGTKVLSLFLASANSAIAAENTYGTAVAYLSNAEQVPITLRFVGENAAYVVDLQGCMCSGGSLNLAAGQVPTSRVQLHVHRPQLRRQRWRTQDGVDVQPHPVPGRHQRQPPDDRHGCVLPGRLQA